MVTGVRCTGSTENGGWVEHSHIRKCSVKRRSIDRRGGSGQNTLSATVSLSLDEPGPSYCPSYCQRVACRQAGRKQ
ncbi:hypothetical protein TYRP_019651 [Tyrophagus putrescentiae]|nr:hypothetical protein TYRP_019651 [Tyrophagus putrescentiae]